MDPIVVGIPSYGPQHPEFWVRFSLLMSTWQREGVEVVGLFNASSMLTDANRNIIVEEFLKTKYEHLLWVDADIKIPLGGVRRLFDAQKTLISGLYFTKEEKTHPVAYWRDPTQTGYKDIGLFERGELMEVDAAGMGCLLTHRSVYEDIVKTHEHWSTPIGGDYLIHKDDINGTIDPKQTAKTDGRVVDGQLRLRMTKAPFNRHFPFFAFEHTKTEDLWFFEKAQRAGHVAWLDTSVACEHWGEHGFGYNDWAERIPGWAIASKAATFSHLKGTQNVEMWEAWREE